MQAAGSKTDHQVSGTNPLGSKQSRRIHNPGCRPGHIKILSSQHSGMFGRLARHQRAIHRLTSPGDAFDHGRNHLGDDPPTGNVIGHEQGPHPRRSEVVNDHSHQVLTDSVINPQGFGQLNLGANPVRRRRQQRAAHGGQPRGRGLIEPRKPAGATQNFRPLGGLHRSFHQLHRPVASLGVHSGARVGVSRAGGTFGRNIGPMLAWINP